MSKLLTILYFFGLPRSFFYQTLLLTAIGVTELALLAIILLLADVSPSYSSGLPQGNGGTKFLHKMKQSDLLFQFFLAS